MDHHYGNQMHMAALSMQSHQQQSGQQHYHHQGGQYQQFYQDYADVCYQSPAYHDAGFSGDQYGYHPTASVPYGTGIESYLDPKYAANPAAFASRLPYLPFHAAAVAAYGMYDYSFEPAFIRKRNERERQRVKCVNEGYARLREHLPEEYAEKRLSKVETLRGAIVYIKQLQSILGFDPEKRGNRKKNDKEKTEEQEKKTNEIEQKSTEQSSGTDTQKQNEGRIDSNDNSHSTQNASNNILRSCAFREHNTASNDIKMESALSTQNGDLEHNYENEESLLPSCAATRFQSCMKAQTNETPIKISSRPSSTDVSQFSPRSNIVSPFDCQIEEERRKNFIERSSCYHRNDLTSSPNSDINANIISWNQTMSKQNSMFNYADEYTNKSYSRRILNNGNNDTETFSAMFRNSRQHPYIKFASMKDTNTERWDNDVRVKKETHTPPPYVQYDLQNQRENLVYPPYRYNYSASFHNNAINMSQPGRGGQSDGFKSDTSPESSSGQSS
ncbi:uncharacterized protein LOC120331382 [Styela clava]